MAGYGVLRPPWRGNALPQAGLTAVEEPRGTDERLLDNLDPPDERLLLGTHGGAGRIGQVMCRFPMVVVASLVSNLLLVGTPALIWNLSLRYMSKADKKTLQ